MASTTCCSTAAVCAAAAADAPVSRNGTLRPTAVSLRRIPRASAAAPAWPALAAAVASLRRVAPPTARAAKSHVLLAITAAAAGQAPRIPAAAADDAGAITLAALPQGATPAASATPLAAAFAAAVCGPAAVAAAAAHAASVGEKGAGVSPVGSAQHPPLRPGAAAPTTAVAAAQASLLPAAAAALLHPAAAAEAIPFCFGRRTAHWFSTPAAAVASSPPCRRLLARAATPLPSKSSQQQQQSPQQLLHHLQHLRQLQQHPRFIHSLQTPAQPYRNTAAAYACGGREAHVVPSCESSPTSDSSCSNSSASSLTDSSSRAGGNSTNGTTSKPSSNNSSRNIDGTGTARASSGGSCASYTTSSGSRGMQSIFPFSGGAHDTTSRCCGCSSTTSGAPQSSGTGCLLLVTGGGTAASPRHQRCTSTGSSSGRGNFGVGKGASCSSAIEIEFVCFAAGGARRHGNRSSVAAVTSRMLEHVCHCCSSVGPFALQQYRFTSAAAVPRKEEEQHQQSQSQLQQQQIKPQAQLRRLQEHQCVRKQRQWHGQRRQQRNTGLLQRFHIRRPPACGVAEKMQESRLLPVVGGRLPRWSTAASHSWRAWSCVLSVVLPQRGAAAALFTSAAAAASGSCDGGPHAREGAAPPERRQKAAAAGERRSGEMPVVGLMGGRNAGGLPQHNKTESGGGTAVHEAFPWRAAILACCACISIACAVVVQSERRKRAQTARTESDAVGKPLLGGPWTLVDSTGRLRSSSDFEGKYVLLYFGFSFCPDICPQELEKMAQVIERIDKEFGEVVQPIFITVDPQRDTVAQVQAYCREFHPRLLGFTGTKAQIKDVTRKFRVYYNEGIRSTEEDYLVDHSIIQYFLGRNGKFKDFFGKNMTAREIGDKVTSYIRHDLEVQKKKGGKSE